MNDGIECLLNDLPPYLRESAKLSLGITVGNDNHRDEMLSDEVNKIYKLVLEKRDFLNSIIANGINLNKASVSEKIDERLILTALNSNPKSLEFATSVYQDREDIVFLFINKDSSIYKFVSPRLKNTKELVMQAVKINGLVLEHVSNDLKNDFDVVYEAVKNNGMALKYASHNMQLDRTIVKKAIEENGRAIKYANSKLWSSDKELILIALKTFGARLYIHDIDEKLKNDVDFILECCKIEPKFFSFASCYVKDILRVKNIKSYVETLFNNSPMEINESSRENRSIGILLENTKAEDYYEFEKKKNKFIKKIKKYYLDDRLDNDLLYEILKNNINYEIDLSISSIVYPITDFNKQFDMFKRGIVNAYDLFLNSYCSEYDLSNLYLINNINYDTLPNDFFNQFANLKDNSEKKKYNFKGKLLELKEKFLVDSEHSIFMDCIDRKIDKCMDDFAGEFDYDIKSVLKKFTEFLDKIENVLIDINVLWDMFYSIDIRIVSASELKYFRANLSIEGIKKDLEILDIDSYALKLKQLKKELSLYDNDKGLDNIQSIYQLVLDEYHDTIIQLSEDPGFYDGNSNFFDVISDVFLDFYDFYSKLYKKGDCSIKDICELKAYFYIFQDRINSYRNTQQNDFNTTVYLSLAKWFEQFYYSDNFEYKKSLDEVLKSRYYFILKQYIEKVSNLRLGAEKNILKALNKKMAETYNIYLSCKFGSEKREEGLAKLNEIDLDDIYGIILIDDIRIELPTNDDFCGKYYYNVNDFSMNELDILMTTSDGYHVYKCPNYDEEKTIPLRKFIENMEYAGVWDVGVLGIRNVIYKNNDYCLIIQNDICDCVYFLVFPVSNLSDRLMPYNDNVVEAYRCYASKEKFMHDFERILEDRYLESINKKEKKKKFYYGD